MRLSLRHLAAFSSALPSQVVPSLTAAFQLGCSAKDFFSAWREAGFLNGFVGMNTFPNKLGPGAGPPERRCRPPPVSWVPGRWLHPRPLCPPTDSIGKLIGLSSRRGQKPRTRISWKRSAPWNGNRSSFLSRRIALPWKASRPRDWEWLIKTKSLCYYRGIRIEGLERLENYLGHPAYIIGIQIKWAMVIQAEQKAVSCLILHTLCVLRHKTIFFHFRPLCDDQFLIR